MTLPAFPQSTTRTSEPMDKSDLAAQFSLVACLCIGVDLLIANA